MNETKSVPVSFKVEDIEEGTYSAVGTVFGFIKSPHTQPADVAGSMIARSNGMMGNGICANEADFGIVVGLCIGWG